MDDILERSRTGVIVLGPDLRPRGTGRPIRAARPWPVLIDPDGAADGTWRLRPQVTLIVQDETVRVLDTRGGTFYALGRLGTRMLLAALRGGSGAMARRLADEYQVPASEVSADWAALVGQLTAAGLAEPVRPKSRGPALPGRFGVWFRLALARLCFALLGWEKTVRLWSRAARRDGVRPPAGWEAIVARVDELVNTCASRHVLNPQCKERALVSWRLLTGLGLPARLVMGVMLYPFAAHAWAECAGRIVGDDLARCEQFVPVAVHE
jgi:hypothetical protein